MRPSEIWSAPAFPDIVVLPHGRVPDLELERVAGAVGRLLARHRIDGGARVRVATSHCEGGPMLVQVNLRVAGKPVRMQTMTPGPGAVLPVVSRLEAQLMRTGRGRQRCALHTPPRPPLRSAREASITRRKNYSVRTMGTAEAVSVLDAMDYDAHLFTDAETGDDAVVYRGGPAGVELHRQRAVTRPLAVPSWPMTTRPHPAPRLTEAQATVLLCAHSLPFLFFTDAHIGRGHLLYRRYDATLGLITPCF